MKSRAKDHALATLVFLGLALVSVGISGGPVYGTNGNITITGNYSGVLTPQPCTTATPAAGASATPLPGRCGANSIGVFSISVPKTGSATGPMVVFNNGQAYTGTIQGTGDSVKAKITGLFHGTFSFTEQVITGTEDTTDTNGTTHHKVTFGTQTFAAQGVGQVSAKARSLATGATTAIRLKGKADVQFSLTVNEIDDDIAYVVTGSKQSEAQ